MENNFLLTGDEARILMMALLSSEASLPANKVLALYLRLNEINVAQPRT